MFIKCANLISIILPYNITSIESSALNSCHNLKSVEIFNSVKSKDQRFENAERKEFKCLADYVLCLSFGLLIFTSVWLRVGGRHRHDDGSNGCLCSIALLCPASQR